MTTREKSASDPWIVRFRRRPKARLRLLCFPFAGGGPSFFYPWAEHMPEDVELVALHPPGREGRMREAAYRRVGPLVDGLLTALRPLLDREIALFGHSLGALLAFEVARELSKEQGRGPAHLLVSGRCAPHLPVPVRFANLSETSLVATLAALNGTPPAVMESAELMGHYVPLLRADLEVTETYQFVNGPGLACPITVWGAREDAMVSAESLEAWRGLSLGRFTLHRPAGDHFSYVRRRGFSEEIVVALTGAASQHRR